MAKTRYITVVFSYTASDEEDPERRGEIVDDLVALAEQRGLDGPEIHHEDMLERGDEA